MNTLSNVDVRRGGTIPPDIGFTSNVLPEAPSLPRGVSVEYAPAPTKQWFVLRATYNRENKAYKYLTGKHVDAYIPFHHVHKFINGKKKRVQESLLPNMLFVYADRQTIDNYLADPELHFLNYYYNHFETDLFGKNPPLTIDYSEMQNFIRLTSIDNEHIKLVEPNHCHYKSGDKVRIIEGDFKGIVGRVARVAGQQRVVVKIEGVCTIATAYIPSAFLEDIL